MSRNSSSSMYGGAGGRDSRASVSSLQGLRNALRPDSQPPPPSQPNNEPKAPAATDDKKTMEGLNTRLSGYLGKVKKLEQSNKELEEQIEEILKKRGETPERDWDEVEKPLDELRKQIRDIGMENARLIVQIDNNTLASQDFKNRLKTEEIARYNLEHELAELRHVIDDNQLRRLDLEGKIESTREELAYLKKEHCEEVAVLKQKIKDSNVTVESDSSPSNLSETINKIRAQYEKLALKNREDTDEWYRTKFESMKVDVAKNTESLQYSRTELNELRRLKQLREIDLQTLHNTISSLEDAQKETEDRYRRELDHLNRIVNQREIELTNVRNKVEQQASDYQDLLSTKMKLEAEINEYRKLLGEIEDSGDLSLEQALYTGPSQNEGGKAAAGDQAPPQDSKN